MAGCHPAPGPHASSAQIGEVKSCLQMWESLRCGEHTIPQSTHLYPVPALTTNKHQLSCPATPGVPQAHCRLQHPPAGPAAPLTAPTQTAAPALSIAPAQSIRLACTLLPAGRPSPPDFAICRRRRQRAALEQLQSGPH